MSETGTSGASAGEEPGDAGPPLLQVGTIVKPHGLRGDVIVALATNRQERVAAGSILFGEDGTEYRVVRSSPHKGRWIVMFEGCNGIDAAGALRGTDLFAPALDDSDVLWVHDLVGSEAVDTEGTVLGTVESVQANPASDLLVLSGGALVPLRFVVSNDPGVRVTIDAPDGLFDLG
ncbi:MAG TPA: ribosome maturation factor RimM [Acidimicrobiales bacterium]